MWKYFVPLKASAFSWYTGTFACVPLVRSHNVDRFSDCGVGRYGLTVNLGKGGRGG